MKILTFDTALNKTYICLSENDTVIEKLTIENREDKYHSAFLIQEIANILKKHNLQMKDIEAAGINVGPGSFTGIRACTTVGRVIAQQLDLPLVPVSSLEILSKISGAQKTLTTLDARKNSAYIGIYQDGEEIVAPKIVSVEELIKTAKDDITIICDTAMYNKLKENNIDSINYEKNDYPLNEYLMRITVERLSKCIDAKKEYNWAKVKPLYIQPPSVFGGTIQASSFHCKP